MKIILKDVRQRITYNSDTVFIDNIACAKFMDYKVTWISNSKNLADFSKHDDAKYCILNCGDQFAIYANVKDNTIRYFLSNKILAHYEGNPFGALASYAAFVYYKEINSSSDTAVRNSVNTSTQNKSNVKAENINNFKPNEVPKQIKFETLEYEKKQYEPEPPKYEKPKYEETRHEVRKPNIPIPSGGGYNSSDGSGAGCIWAILGIIALFVAVKMIPGSWKDLSTYIPDGDIGITICFFSAVIGAIIAVGMSLFVKSPSFLSCISAFLGTCGIGIVINSFILLKDILAGDYEFTGFILFDIPLAIFAPILGCFQFALPIGIGVLIVCGIICLIKKS